MLVRFFVLLLVAVVVAGQAWATSIVTRFGIRNTGASYELAGGDSGISTFEVRADGTLMVRLKAAVDPTSITGYVEGTKTALPVVATGPDAVQFKFTPPKMNEVKVVVIDADPLKPVK